MSKPDAFHNKSVWNSAKYYGGEILMSNFRLVKNCPKRIKIKPIDYIFVYADIISFINTHDFLK